MGKSRDILSRPFIRGLRSRDGGVIASECRVQLATRHPLPPARTPPPPPPGWSPQPGHTRTTPPTQNRPRYVPPVRPPLTPSSRPRTMNSQTNSAPTTSPSSATTPSAGSSAKVTPCYPPHALTRTGTYGSVHLATHRLTGTRAAVKKVPKSFTPHLTRELHHHRRLHHPHIVHLHEIIATESHIWLVTELCSGGELFDYLVERGRILEGEARRLFGELTLAVGWLHMHGVVHRDLKLENVLLDGELRIKLGDLGFAREWQKGRLYVSSGVRVRVLTESAQDGHVLRHDRSVWCTR